MAWRGAPAARQPQPASLPELDGATQWLAASHTKPLTQSSSDAQLSLQTLPSHLKGAQSVVVPSGLPITWSPSHEATSRGTQSRFLASQRNLGAQSWSPSHGAAPQPLP